MGIFAAINRRGAPAGTQTAGEAEWIGAPTRFEAVADLLTSGRDVTVACSEVGRELARDGADLGEALSGLKATWAAVVGGDPDFAAVRALSVAWGEETLGYVHQLSCEDPLTGLATRGHLRARLGEVYRAAEQRGSSASSTHALVVLDLPLLAAGGPAQDPFSSALWLVKLAETVRLVFSGEEVIAQASRTRLVTLAERGDLLARRVGLLRDLVNDLGPDMGRARTWIEGLPSTIDGAAWLLDEVARS
jgi:hypothetical protein